MALSTTIRSRSAIGVGVFFTAVTTFVLLEDVLRYGAPVTTKHIMTLAVLAGTIYFGHRFKTEAVSLRIGTAFGCAVLFVAGTGTCVIMSAGRNAEVVTAKALSANAVNVGRESARKDRDEARARYKAALKAEEDECASGNGAKCSAKRVTRMVRREEYDEAETRFGAQRPEQIANPDIKAAAALLAKLPYVTVDEPAMEAILLLFFPFMLSLFCEIGAIVGYSIGLGHVSAKIQGKTPQFPLLLPPSDTPDTVETVPAFAAVVPSDVAVVVAALRRIGRPVTNDELAHAMAITKSEASKRVAAAGAAGVIEKVRVGRAVQISLAQQAA